MNLHFEILSHETEYKSLTSQNKHNQHVKNEMLQER